MKQVKTADGYAVLFPGGERRGGLPAFLGDEECALARRFMQTVPGYCETPLVRLPALARELGLSGIYVKDESTRFGLNAFKGLGGMMAVFRVVCGVLRLNPRSARFEDLRAPQYRACLENITFVTATDGNHGRGVAWAANQLGCASCIYMPVGSAPSRVENIRRCGAREVIVTDLHYDDTVRLAAETAQERGWHLVQDTAFEGYETVPGWIAQGYTVLGEEALAQLREAGAAPTHLFLQAGVGSFAGSILGYFAKRMGTPPKTVVVEPREVACFYESMLAGDGRPHPATGSQQTIMAGLNCAEPSLNVFPVLRDWAFAYAACPDEAAESGMRALARPLGEDRAVVSGESGAAPLGLLLALMQKEELRPAREALGLDESSVVLLVSTEGDTDPENYRRIVGEKA